MNMIRLNREGQYFYSVLFCCVAEYSFKFFSYGADQDFSAVFRYPHKMIVQIIMTPPCLLDMHTYHHIQLYHKIINTTTNLSP